MKGNNFDGRLSNISVLCKSIIYDLCGFGSKVIKTLNLFTRLSREVLM